MLKAAIEAAKIGEAVATKYFQTDLKVIKKPDNSPVTIADKESEKAIRQFITKKYQNHGIIGEEFEPTNPQAQFKWVIDPIDGTRDYIRGLPFWATFVAVVKDDKPIIGVAYYPILNELFSAEIGKGAYLNGKKTKVSKVKKLSDATVCHGRIKRFEEKSKLGGLFTIMRNAQNNRNFGSYSFALVAKGQVDVDIEAAGGYHDYAAPSIILQEAGGRFSDFDGKFSLNSGSGIFTNGLVHNEVLKLLNS